MLQQNWSFCTHRKK